MDSTIIKIDQAPVFERGGGVATTPLVIKGNISGAAFTSGITRFPPGEGAPMHSHNCAEQVTLLEGCGVVEVDGELTELEPHDTTYIPADKPHRFYNTGPEPLVILWIYGAADVTRTFTDSGETVEHLSSKDVIGGQK